MDETLLRIAEVMAEQSTCDRKHVGAVISRRKRVLATGYNGAPSGMPHCQHTLLEPNDMTCTVAVHAELNAIAFAARHGIATEGAAMYTSMTPCRTCAQAIINAGIVRFVAREEYRLRDGANLLREAGVTVYLLPRNASMHGYHDEPG